MNEDQGELFNDLVETSTEWKAPPPEDEPQPDPSAEAEARFQAFHRENPAVYRQMVKFAREALAAGAGKLGARELWERLRWWVKFETVDAETDFKLDNNLCAYYARHIMATEPDLVGIFETRKLKHERGGDCEHSN